MDSTRVNVTDGPVKIQSAINLLNEAASELLSSKLGLNNEVDFVERLKTIETKVDDIFSDANVKSQLRTQLRRAMKIRSDYVDESFDVIQFYHDFECMTKLAFFLGQAELQNKVMELFTVEGMDSSTRGWDRALLEMRISKLQLAIEDSEDAIQLDPNQVKFYRILSEALCALGHIERAAKICNDGLKVDPKDETLLLRLQSCEAHVADHKAENRHLADGWESSADYAKASTDDGETLFNLGVKHLEGRGKIKKDLDKAEEYFRMASDLNNQEATLALAELLLQRGRNREALPFVKTAAESGSEAAQKTLGLLLCLGHGCERDTSQGRLWLLRSRLYSSIEDVENYVDVCYKVLDYESREGLSCEGLTCDDRISRCMASFMPNHEVKQTFEDIMKFTQYTHVLRPCQG